MTFLAGLAVFGVVFGVVFTALMVLAMLAKAVSGRLPSWTTEAAAVFAAVVGVVVLVNG